MKYNKTWMEFSQQIFDLCPHFDEVYCKRDRRIGSFEVIHGVLKLKSAAFESYRSIFSDSDQPFAASSFCAARKKFPAQIFATVREEMLAAYESKAVKVNTWNERRVFAVDGSVLNLPSGLQKEGYQQMPGNHYPQGLLTTIFNVLDRTIHGLDFSNNRCERQAASRLAANLGKGDILLGDKGFLSFGFLCELSQQGIDAVFSLQAGTTFKEIVAFRESDLEETIVELDPSKNAYCNARKGFPEAELEPQQVRLIKYKFKDSYEILVTTLLDKEITAADIGELYWLRWRIEELYKAFKNVLDIENFHSKSANGVEQELHAASIVWNFSRFLEAYIPESAFKKKQ